MRDDFPQNIRRSLAQRVGLLCSNPECRAHTTGPQSDPLKIIDVGVAAHITAASSGGPRFDPTLTDKERAGIANAIWLCQNCAKLIDSDVVRFSSSVLRGWKLGAEWEAKKRIGKTNNKQARSNVRAEKLETFDFYHNGIEGILDIEYALISDESRHWALLKESECERRFPPGFQVAKIFKTGRIPWRNIRHFDLRGDDFYSCPHFYCLYADDGMPYEGFGYYLIPNDDSYEFELQITDRVDLGVLLSVETNVP